jgi:hypothetical protein
VEADRKDDDAYELDLRVKRLIGPPPVQFQVGMPDYYVCPPLADWGGEVEATSEVVELLVRLLKAVEGAGEDGLTRADMEVSLPAIKWNRLLTRTAYTWHFCPYRQPRSRPHVIFGQDAEASCLLGRLRYVSPCLDKVLGGVDTYCLA